MNKPNVDALRHLKSYFCKDLDVETSYTSNNLVETTTDRANLISSKAADTEGINYLLLDIDENAQVWESSTPGHYHIAFKRAMSDDMFGDVVTALRNAGIIAEGNYAQYTYTDQLFLRTPWVGKGETKELYEHGVIGPPPRFEDEDDARRGLQEACDVLGEEALNEMYQQLQAKKAAKQALSALEEDDFPF